MTDEVCIRVNDGEERRPAGTTVEALLASLGLGGTPCAVEVNRSLVRHGEHASRELCDGDRVEIVTLVGGG